MKNRLLFVLSICAACALLPSAVSAEQGVVGGTPPQGTPPPAGTPTPTPQGASGRGGVAQPRSITVAKAPGAADLQRHGPQAFSVVLVVGEMQSAGAIDDVPPAARKALTDMRDFLPYKSYRLLDSHWTLCCGKGPTFSRLRGLDDQEYELQLTPTITYAGSSGHTAVVVNVRFMLMEAAPSRVESARQADELRKEFEAALRRRQLAEKGLTASSPGDERMKALEQELAAQERRQAGWRSSRQMMDASFRMDVGETVVVGTSRIQGDKALIALLTAVPPKSGGAR